MYLDKLHLDPIMVVAKRILFIGCTHLAAGLCCGLSGLGSGMCIGIADDAGVIACGKLNYD